MFNYYDFSLRTKGDTINKYIKWVFRLRYVQIVFFITNNPNRTRIEETRAVNGTKTKCSQQFNLHFLLYMETHFRVTVPFLPRQQIRIHFIN